jgi:hypothetical protein
MAKQQAEAHSAPTHARPAPKIKACYVLHASKVCVAPKNPNPARASRQR